MMLSGDWVNTNMTCFQGKITCSYMDLLEIFGLPTFDEPSADGKTDVEWHVKWDDDTVATIYNWKDYDGGITAKSSVEYTWHIGGFNINAVEKVFNEMEELLSEKA